MTNVATEWSIYMLSTGVVPNTLHYQSSLKVSNAVSATFLLFSEHELTFTFAICYRPSVCRL